MLKRASSEPVSRTFMATGYMATDDGSYLSQTGHKFAVTMEEVIIR